MTLNDATENRRDADVTVDVTQSTRNRAGGDGPHVADHHDRLDNCRPGDGVQRERRGGGESIPRLGILPEAPARLDGVRFSLDACGVPRRLCLVEATMDSSPWPHGDPLGDGSGPVVGARGEGRQAVAESGAHCDPTGGNRQARGRDLSRRLSGKEGGAADHLLGRSGAAVARDRGDQRPSSSGTRFGNRRGDGIGDHWPAVPGRRAPLSSPVARVVHSAGRFGARPRLKLSAAAADDVPGAMEGRVGYRISDHPILLGIRKWGALRSGVGRRQTKTLFSAGSAHRLCVGAGRGRTRIGGDGGYYPSLRHLRREGVSNFRTGKNAIRPIPGHGRHTADRYSGVDQCLRRDRPLANQGIDAAVCQLRRIFSGDLNARGRNFAQHLTGSAGGTGRSGTKRRRSGSAMTVVIAAGGTGGHLYPAVALAREFLRRDPSTTILFVGTRRGIESKVLAHEGFELLYISAKPVMGKGLLDVIRGVFSVPIALRQSLDILRQRQADVVIGVGGYTSPTMLVAAALRGITRVILEPNAYPGMANKVVAPFAQRIFLAFESAANSFDRGRVRVVGTPIRQGFLAEVGQSEGLPSHTNLRLLIFGGSQGAQAINHAVLDGLGALIQLVPTLDITHQTGESDYQRVRETYEQLGVRAEIAPFLYDMPKALRTADLVVARAGAMTIAELAACGKPAILIPLPTAIYDHQMKNARAMEEAGGATVLPQADLTGSRLNELISGILLDPERLRAMSAKSREMRRVDAAQAIVQECYALMGVEHESNGCVGTTGD